MEDIKQLIDKKKLPKHVAIIMDGNGRWATSQGKERTFGHKSAIQAVRNAVNACNEIEIPYLTLYTFSTENWNRPEEEVSALMNLLFETLLNEADDLYSKGLRLKVIGDISAMPKMVYDQLNHVMEITKDNKGGTLILALNYGSQAEILNAVKNIAKEVKNTNLQPENITKDVFESFLYTKDIPPVDLMIRTSGEVRISNFLLWQIAYAELQFLDILWPDFTREEFFKAIVRYQNKERRYGKTSDQIKADKA
ncbi:isoprenyl transferase [Elizabethkingia sp. JS20170427COW]|uniref:isoprenyl transferase n=1 Tax=Elizabethkingia sp. JS20170427COW TaxID=2583851 RepID=UPI001110EBE3|nr:isoprenyl transferase [Elizabethkingia sp. JS20170427COW]QCX53305.1 isoprenyl transferase [Elizabethkingia sp. JS20170427COW]